MRHGATPWTGSMRVDGTVIWVTVRQLRSLFDAFRADRTAQMMILGLIGLNALLWGLYLFSGFSDIGARFRPLIWADHGFGEQFNIIQIFVCSTLLMFLWRRTKELIYIAFSVLFFLIFAFESLKLHTYGGVLFAQNVEVASVGGFRAQDLGEFLTALWTGIPLVVFLYFGFRNSTHVARCTGVILGLSAGLLLFFAVGIDALAAVLKSRRLGLIEEIGEIFAMTIACALAIILYRHPDIAGSGYVTPRWASATARRVGTSGRPPHRRVSEAD